LVFIPLIIGVLCGLALILGDKIFSRFNELGQFPHPPFPVSILASLSAGIGEEIAFRGFFFGLWALILRWLFRRFNGQTAALWIANILAALAFGAGHLGGAMVIVGASSLTALSPVLLVEIFLLNGIVGIAAGQQYIKSGLIAAAGVHFWTDVVWHVLWGLSA
jgi:membrane protease YdiL (CAAX protease family)